MGKASYGKFQLVRVWKESGKEKWEYVKDGAVINQHTAKLWIQDEQGNWYRRVPRPEPKSRATRFQETVSTLEDIAQDLISLADEDDVTFEALKERANELLGKIDFTEIETLKDEMEEWRDNLDGANMTHLPKYDEVSEAADNLDSILSELEGVDTDELVFADDRLVDIDELREEIRRRGEELEAAAQSNEVDFPGMF